jgi:hypothetical protein
VAAINPHDQLHARAAEVRAVTVSAGLGQDSEVKA